MSKRRRPAYQPTLPFGLYTQFMQAGLQTSELWSSAAEVIGYRSHLIAQAMNGQLPFSHREFADMWEEKIRAGMDAYVALWDIAHSANAAELGATKDFLSWGEKMLSSQLEVMKAVTTPYHKRSMANAKRLRRKPT